MKPLRIPIRYESESQQRLSYATPGDAGLDLRSSENYSLKPGERKLIHTGTYVAIPEGHVGMVCPRSGLAAKHGITIVNAPGIIDSGYRGELGVILLNTDMNAPFDIEIGDRIAQLVIAPFAVCELDEVTELDETERGSGGFGHSGIK